MRKEGQYSACVLNCFRMQRILGFCLSGRRTAKSPVGHYVAVKLIRLSCDHDTTWQLSRRVLAIRGYATLLLLVPINARIYCPRGQFWPFCRHPSVARMVLCLCRWVPLLFLYLISTQTSTHSPHQQRYHTDDSHIDQSCQTDRHFCPWRLVTLFSFYNRSNFGMALEDT